MKRNLFLVLFCVFGVLSSLAQKLEQTEADVVKDLESWIKSADSELNTGYVYIGCLRRNSVLNSYRKDEMLPYQKVDIRLLKEITVPSAYPRIIGIMPNNSYKILHIDFVSSKLIINDPDRFWEFTSQLDIHSSCGMLVDSTGIHTHDILPNLFDTKKCKMSKIPEDKDITLKMKSLKAKAKTLSEYLDSLADLSVVIDMKLHSCFILITDRTKLKKSNIIRFGSTFSKPRIKWETIDKSIFQLRDMREGGKD